MYDPRNKAVAGDQGAVPRGVRRVLRAVRAAPGQNFSLNDLAGIAGVSVRTLQRQFRAFLGQTAISALRDIRLEGARRELLRGGPSVTVAGVALRHGLTHFGRFSVEYRRRYGERPSQTLRRQTVLEGAQQERPQLFVRHHDRPAIAVIPLEPRGVDPALALGIADELLTALSRAGMAVTDRAERAHYHVRGVCRGSGTHVRVTIRLLDATTGRHIWAHDQDGTTGESLQLEERLAQSIAAALQASLRAAEIDRVRHLSDSDLTAHELALKAWPYVTALDPEGHQRAIELLGRATDRDPEHALALALMAWCHAQRAVYQFTDNTAEERTQAASLAARAMRIGGDGTTFAILGHALACAHELQAAGAMTRRALLLDGGSSWAWGRSAWLDVYSGRPEAAIERFAISLELAPHDPMTFNNFGGLGCAYFHLGRYGEAAHWMARMIAEHPAAAWASRVLCPAFLLSGNKDEARRRLAVVRRLYPGSTASQCASAAPLPRRDQELIAEGLESLGLRA